MTAAQPWFCPFCQHKSILTSVNTSQKSHDFNCHNKHKVELRLTTKIKVCPNPACREYAIEAFLSQLVWNGDNGGYAPKLIERWKIRPSGSAKPFPEYVPQPIREDYEEACAIVHLSPKASATLSRRCLQGIVRDFWNIKKGTLHQELQALRDHIDPITWQAIDAVRDIGNIGAHMEQNINLVIDVDQGEAEALARLIEVLITEWYVHRHERELHMQRVIDAAAEKKAIKAGSKRTAQEELSQPQTGGGEQ
ncbi:DUF4145 domain-containing protein [Halomonas desiderata]|uniref:DUF4145 domain-containing protein n=1 Tax=Billgrantia desiderata TaxID=52021 RepID=UPI00174C491C|nr:DUF4145 domain-containing protein [Halomonas desiderata]